MSILEQIDKFIHKRLSHSSVENDNEIIETDETRKINNVIAAPLPSPPPTPTDKETKQRS